jgi:hypothetical protein
MAIRAYDTFDRGESRAMDARAANDRIAAKAEQLHFLSRVPMMCECSSPGCRKIMMVGLDEYREIRSEPDLLLTAPGHAADCAEVDREAAGYEVRRRTREHGDGDAGRRSA